MFDRTFVEGAKHTTNVEVKQAGLHDAVKNYKEFRDDAEREAARAEIAKFGADNCVRYLRIDKQHLLESDNMRTNLLYSVNGQVFQLEKVFDRISFKDRRDEKRIIAEAIAEEIVRQLLGTRML